jgi:hypothetical protein
MLGVALVVVGAGYNPFGPVFPFPPVPWSAPEANCSRQLDAMGVTDAP